MHQRTALTRQCRDEGVIDRIDHHEGVLGGTGCGIVEGLGGGDLFGGGVEIGGLVDDHGDIARADPDGGRAAGIGAAHVVLAAGHDHEVGGFEHPLRLGLGAGGGNHLNEVMIEADLVEFGVDVAQQHVAGRDALGRGREHDGIAAFQRVDDIVGGGRRRVGRGYHGADHPDGAGDLGDAGGPVVADHAVGFHPGDVAHQAQCLAVVLGDLVGHVAKPGRFDRQFGQGAVARGFHDRPCGGLRGPVIAFLRGAVLEGLLRGTGAGHDAVDGGKIVGGVHLKVLRGGWTGRAAALSGVE